jgi:seryl-tRNA synthetase
MLDKRFIRENPELVKKAVRDKGVTLDVDQLLKLDTNVRSLQHQVDEAQRERRELASSFQGAQSDTRESLRTQATALDEHLQTTKEQLEKANSQLHDLMLITPQIPWEHAPIGNDESANVVIKTWGEKPNFTFELLDHVDLAEKRGWVEFARARNVTGTRG